LGVPRAYLDRPRVRRSPPLTQIVVKALTNNAPQYYDIALRDFGLMLAALTLGRLALAVVPAHKRLRD
jgi:hypothetical protein